MAARVGMSEAEFWDSTPGYVIARFYWYQRAAEEKHRSDWERTRWEIRALGGLQISKKHRHQWQRATRLPWDDEHRTDQENPWATMTTEQRKAILATL